MFKKIMLGGVFFLVLLFSFTFSSGEIWQYNYLPSENGVSSVDSGDNCIFVSPTTGEVIITFNSSCGGSGGGSGEPLWNANYSTFLTHITLAEYFLNASQSFYGITNPQSFINQTYANQTYRLLDNHTFNGNVEITNNLTTGGLFMTPANEFSSSTSVGGAFNLINTNNDGAGIVVYSANDDSQEGHLFNGRANNFLFDKSIYYGTNNGQSHTSVFLYTGNDSSSSAINIASSNKYFSAGSFSGNETSHGSVKVTHHYPNEDDSDASALSLNLDGVGTSAQGLYIYSDGNTSGDLIDVNNYGENKFRVNSTGNVEINENIDFSTNPLSFLNNLRGINSLSSSSFFFDSVGTARWFFRNATDSNLLEIGDDYILGSRDFNVSSGRDVCITGLICLSDALTENLADNLYRSISNYTFPGQIIANGGIRLGDEINANNKNISSANWIFADFFSGDASNLINIPNIFNQNLNTTDSPLFNAVIVSQGGSSGRMTSQNSNLYLLGGLSSVDTLANFSFDKTTFYQNVTVPNIFSPTFGFNAKGSPIGLLINANSYAFDVGGGTGMFFSVNTPRGIELHVAETPKHQFMMGSSSDEGGFWHLPRTTPPTNAIAGQMYVHNFTNGTYVLKIYNTDGSGWVNV